MPLPSPAPRRGIRLGLAALLFAANLALQLGMSARGLDDAPVNALHPTASDALEYVRAAEALAEGGGNGFAEAFGSAWRTPGYSLFLAGMEHVADAPLRTARVIQILLTATIAPLLLWTLSTLAPLPAAMAGAALAAAWPPLYHYSAALLAEPLSLWLMALLLLALAHVGAASASRSASGTWLSTTRLAGFAGVLLAALVYLKPNHALLALPVCGFILATDGWGGARGWRAVATTLGVATLLLVPWSLYASRQQGSFVALSTTSGYNLYLGTGVPPVDADDGSLPARAARALGLRGGPEALPQEPAHETGVWPSARWSAGLGRTARGLWWERPAAESLYGATKMLHAFGFSLRDARDAMLALFTLVAAVAAATAWRHGRRAWRPWIVFFGLCALTVALQAFLWLPNQRLKTVLFDLPALQTLSLGAAAWASRRARNDAAAKETGE